ncbi:hypothetical protein A2837_02150 [Candidatus Kaiserbacteria bacterium RIFCSPHIGHO2_01_FULL_46_22]|uniref:Uncharacterized protein n=1 Tax=Candidatus Kaiserbacteria bacterium RIFCSPHIGHO2_01_FULL_46_22 TaxID=1798475 RepID=A0A1F6BYT8_9BACT|nr:MAG: hypothetical protein A2837_02150 [Candidatus Kaiserbacteria bacterium RIFCSPHIGHO2_01_FULL_46_22]
MTIIESIASSAETEIWYGQRGEEYEKPGMLQALSQQAFLCSIGFSIGMILALMLDSQALLVTPVIPALAILASVSVEVALMVTRPMIQQKLPRELRNWVTRHQWIHGAAILISGALFIHLVIR